MHHRARPRIASVNLQMQQQLAGAHPVACQNVAVQIGEADVRRLHVPLAHHGRRAQQIALAQPHADVAAVAVHILALPQLAADSNNLHAQRVGLRRAGRRKRRRLTVNREQTRK